MSCKTFSINKPHVSALPPLCFMTGTLMLDPISFNFILDIAVFFLANCAQHNFRGWSLPHHSRIRFLTCSGASLADGVLHHVSSVDTTLDKTEVAVILTC